MIAPAASAAIEHLLRTLAPQVLGSLTRRYGDLGDGDDAVQEAMIDAEAQWRVYGVPENPAGWLRHVASRRLMDHARSESSRRERERRADPADWLASSAGALADEDPTHDDTLTLLFMCCHPALTQTSSIALTLRAIGGLTTAEIASAFMIPEATMAQRISRAKQSVRSSGVAFELPAAEEWDVRLGAVLHVVYLIFSEGYTASSGLSVQRSDLAGEAIRIGRLLRHLRPESSAVAGLLALMLLTHARRDARTGAQGELIPLDAQDRSRWHVAEIAGGVALAEEAMRGGEVGAYQLQAAIAALHDEAPSTTETDWAQIAALYGVLQRMHDNPMMTLNRAVAVAMVDGPEAGLRMLASLDDDPRVKGHHRLHAVRGHLLELSGDPHAARRAYMRAAEGTRSIPERDYLVRRAAMIPE